ncbi:MAG: integrase/recombinase XerD [Gaiellaceae bacterium]|nr:integrase/recombinase XerD [Gaiellaceae bacterium]
MNIDPRYTADSNGYLAWKRRGDQNFAPSTEKKWVPIILRFEKIVLRLDTPVADINSKTLDMLLLPAMEREYIERYSREPSRSTWRGWHDALRSFFHYLHAVGAVKINPMLALTKPDYHVEAIDCLTPAEDQAIAACTKDELEEVVIGLAREAGLRAEEIAELADDDVDLETGQIRIRGGKTKASSRSIPIVLTLRPKLARYRSYKCEQGIDSARFVVTESGRISKGYIWVIVKRVAARADVRVHARDADGRPQPLGKGGQNLSAVSPHVLRRTCGLDLLNRDVSLAIVSDLLGHANQAITEKAYARPLQEMRTRRALFAAEAGPYAPGKAIAGIETRIIELPTHRAADPVLLLGQIEELMGSLESMRAAIEDASVPPRTRVALRVA